MGVGRDGGRGRLRAMLPEQRSRLWIVAAVPAVALTVLASCVLQRPPASRQPGPEESRALIERLLPASVQDRAGWTTDIYDVMARQFLGPSRQNVCAVLAVVAQESGFQVNPVVPGMGRIAWNEIDTRAAHAGVPSFLLHAALQLKSRTGRTYAERIDAAHTEQDLSDIYEDFIGSVPLGEKLFSEHNPIRTRGPMQVSVAFAEQYQSVKPYPWPVARGIPDELFTRRGSLYFGTGHLLAYPAAYERELYRFADYNAGQYSSRNAAFQAAVSLVTGGAVPQDGALLPKGADAKDAGSTEAALRGAAVHLGLSEEEIHSELAQERSPEFERTRLYRVVFEQADHKHGAPLPRTLLPQIDLHGPKISRKLTTAWYAQRVDGRYQACLRSR